MKTMLSWSSGKDSAWALKVLNESACIEVCGLFTTVNAAFDRVAMRTRCGGSSSRRRHGQPDCLCTPFDIPYPCSNDTERMGAFVDRAKEEGVEAMAFGDLYLADIRAYRERMLAGTGITPLFPLWGQDTGKLARTMIAAGLRAHVTCIDPKRLDPSFVGRSFDLDFLNALPMGVDPCGENGEFHTLAVAGPMFGTEIRARAGEITERDGFVFADFVAAPAGTGGN
ncbi:MAG TPA: ATP-binding protein [Hyphomicrobiaceae bacterium]|nr:ATP-binding protein [Hyphomicrobiaceae bacterium]